MDHEEALRNALQWVKPTWGVEKCYPHSLGLSACFRQPKALSHCRWLHGYALAFTFRFIGNDLDHRNWLLDFGAMKPIKKWLEEEYDHRLCVAADDPLRDHFQAIANLDGAHLNVMPAVGCESFAARAADFAVKYIRSAVGEGVRIEWVRCAEHEGNAAIYHPAYPQPDGVASPGI